MGGFDGQRHGRRERGLGERESVGRKFRREEIHWYIDEYRATPSCLRDMKSPREDARQALSALNAPGPFDQWAHHLPLGALRVFIDLLVGVSPMIIAWNIPRNDHQGNRIKGGIRNTSHGIGQTWS